MAGRKKIERKRRRRAFTLSEEACRILDKLENMSAYIEALIIEDNKKRGVKCG